MLSVELYSTSMYGDGFKKVTGTSLIIQGWRMVRSETGWDAEILVKNPSPRILSKKFRNSKKGKNKQCKNETSRLRKNAFKISRSCQNFPRPLYLHIRDIHSWQAFACMYVSSQSLWSNLYTRHSTFFLQMNKWKSTYSNCGER